MNRDESLERLGGVMKVTLMDRQSYQWQGLARISATFGNIQRSKEIDFGLGYLDLEST